jgi:5-formyltetrahydrofolate cyclo-ligase
VTEPKHPHCKLCSVWQANSRDENFHCPGSPERKAELRQAIYNSLNSMTPEVRRQKSQVICRHLQELPEYRPARTIMAYVALEMEPDPWPLVREAWAAGKGVAMPRVDPPLEEPQIPKVHDRRLLPFVLEEQLLDDPADHPGLRMDVFGIFEPKSAAAEIPVSEIALVLVPCLAFDRRGHRMGKGGGFYDRFLGRQDMTAVSCGLAFSEQVFAQLPNCPHDRPVDVLVTETGITDFRKSRR